jgi:hypothetical protein
MSYEIFSVCNYATSNNEFIKNKKILYNSIDELTKELLLNDKYYHFRIHNDVRYIFFGDLDNYKAGIIKFKEILINFLLNRYNIIVDDIDIKYSKNNKKEGSFHYSIPKYNASLIKLKEIHNNLLNEYKTDFIIKGEKKIEKCIDTTIYSEHWYRCPNQSKGNIHDITKNNKHEIIFGDMKDFIVYYIPDYSIDIDDKIFLTLEKDLTLKKTELNNNEVILKKNKEEEQQLSVYKNNYVLSTTLAQPTLYKKMFDECYSQERFEVYEYWITVGMAIKNTFHNEDEAFDLFNYYSAKGSNYEGTEKTKYKYATLVKKNSSNGFTSATIYYYAITDNKPKFIEIMSKNSFELGQTDMCKYLKIIAGHNFIYKVVGDNYVLYCFNGKFWETDSILFRQCLSNELYEFLKNILIEVYWNSKDFVSLKSKIERLKCVSFKKDIEETYKEYGTNNSINFDEKWYLFGFNNIVYDLEEGNFREYRYDDYISTTCGYDWREPTINELKEVNDLIISIMPIKDERDLFLQIMCTALDGKCLEKFVIFNGGGGNGKGVIDDLLLKALGNYGLIGNNGILFETSKTGSNPEKSNIHKKRLVIFREPSERNKFENSVIKELTGGGTFSARSHHEKTTIKELNLTMIVECNKRPLFAEEPQDAETRRIIDIFFRSTFTTDKTNVDNSNNIFLANPYFKTVEFQDNHKYALMKILFDQYKIYKKNNYIFNVPQSIKERTQLYLELSCNIVQWFKDNYQLTNDKNDTIKIKDLFEDFTNSEYYTNLSRNEKRKYNKSYFIEYIQNNIFFRKYYIEKSTYLRNFIREWKKKDNEENDDNE